MALTWINVSGCAESCTEGAWGQSRRAGDDVSVHRQLFYVHAFADRSVLPQTGCQFHEIRCCTEVRVNTFLGCIVGDIMMCIWSESTCDCTQLLTRLYDSTGSCIRSSVVKLDMRVWWLRFSKSSAISLQSLLSSFMMKLLGDLNSRETNARILFEIPIAKSRLTIRPPSALFSSNFTADSRNDSWC